VCFKNFVQFFQMIKVNVFVRGTLFVLENLSVVVGEVDG
jgi:hypothetical protein